MNASSRDYFGARSALSTPVGNVTIYRLDVLAKKFSAALAADCCSVIKPSSKTPLSMIALFSLIEQIGLPPGKANLVLNQANSFARAVEIFEKA